jgi:hypothetical protein
MGASPHVAGYPRNCTPKASFGAGGAEMLVCDSGCFAVIRLVSQCRFSRHDKRLFFLWYVLGTKNKKALSVLG